MRSSFFLGGSVFAFSIVAACGGSSPVSGFHDGGASDANAPPPGLDSGVTFGNGDSGGFGFGDSGMTAPGADPTTCAQAAMSKSYIGCDYWPTVLANNVWSVFDFAAVVANGGTTTANIMITGPKGYTKTATVAPQQLTEITLPWISELKGADWDECTDAIPFTSSVISHGGAYHLVSSVPVTVYQFDALEYQGKGGDASKNWSSCPGNSYCDEAGMPIGCFSYSNDASLLLPSTAMTGNYRVMGQHGWSEQGQDIMGAYFGVTGTQDATTVTIQISKTGKVVAGGGITATAANGILTFMLNAGDVAEVVGAVGDKIDLSGSLINADKPVQVLSGIPCIYQPEGSPACDHLESSVFPAETLGKHYVVTVPTGPSGGAVGHDVRFFGNVDNTTLTFTPKMPANCKATINAGQVIDCGVVSQDFEVTGDHEFGVGSFMLGGSVLDPASDPSKGDPSQSMSIAVEQYRTKYIFLAPDDYDISYVDIVTPPSNTITLDGAAVTKAPATVSTAYSVIRQKLTAGTMGGSHVITSTAPVGIQVIGYGSYTSYQYPGGLNLNSIAAPPIIPK